MPLLISYDIERDSLRKKIADRLIDAGFTRIQYSVYLGSLPDNVCKQTAAWLYHVPEDERWVAASDSILLLSVHTEQVRNMQVIGQPKWDKDDLSGDLAVLIL